MWSTLFTAASLLGSGIQAGALLMVLLGVCPSFRSAELGDWMRWHVSLDRSIERYMPALNVLTSVSSLILLLLPQPAAVRGLRIAALVCNISLALMSELVNVRLNKQLARRVSVPLGAPGGVDLAEPAGLVAVRERWIRWHVWRTVVVVLGFGLYTAALLVDAA